MKALLTQILFLSLFQSVHAQITYDKSVIKKYKAAFLSRDKSISESPESFSGNFYNGTAVFLRYKIDTLNKNDFKSMNVMLSSPDSINNETFIAHVSPPDTSEAASVSFKSKRDTLFLGCGHIFGLILEHKIIGGRIITTYTEEAEPDSLWLKPGDPKNSTLKIPAKVLQLTFSQKDFNSGDDLYGEVEVVTDPYFQANNYEFTRGFIKKRMYFKYLFKVEL